ncbi:gephyrin-like molybdotransferase Glp [Loktanella sp. SALINAS62]|uniref:molybdenum cofactor synthesis domain-containing protein n=1 Tax=Loktanella sp. SALINAS62 TaxID=2706124 RepID=UPI001B8C572E|nr:gephyrin-like molybdotransferase Glp [Loktanella sp. SALINAS62]MBS1301035.1 molybdopterin molybdenumtransferase MoeA [Loktanella sp. SALINAS62]
MTHDAAFDTVLAVDWSSGHDRGAAPKQDAIWTCLARSGQPTDPVYHRNRQVAEASIADTIAQEHAAGRRVLVIFDLCFAYPAGFAQALTGTSDPLAVWDWFEERVKDSKHANNRFDLAGQINAMFPGIGPFWGNGRPHHDVDHLPRTQKTSGYGGHGLPEFRDTDTAAKGAQSPFKLSGVGVVGSQVIMGLPMLSRLRRGFGADLSVWPFQPATTPIVLAESYFSLLPDGLDRDLHPIKDAAQTTLYATAFSALSQTDMAQCLDVPASQEGWVLGLGSQHLLRAAMPDPVAPTSDSASGTKLTPPPLRNDCFAMPQGAHWTPVDAALDHLQKHLSPVTGQDIIHVTGAAGRILARPVIAARSHPPHPNAAVDGYAFAGPLPPGTHDLPLHPGRSAAGAPFAGTVPQGHALRILTGANIPSGTDTVVLQEDVTASDTRIALHGPLKQGANARRAGEDMTKGDIVLPAGRRLTPADLATLAACGTGDITVRQRLRVGVLSTGDELRDPGSVVDDGQIFDANRAMLLADVAGWGHAPVDLGRAPDDRDRLRHILTQAATRCDAILTSGGASAGDEDHVSALLATTGSFALWRIAVKPGRPLALGLWDGVPVFGLPGNPVAAQVCALIFAYPALAVLAGADWQPPQSFTVPAGFSKSKKPGRREYLRARINDGAAQVFPSEGSGRVSGLSWATGLVALPDDGIDVRPGTPVTFLPFTGFS